VTVRGANAAPAVDHPVPLASAPPTRHGRPMRLIITEFMSLDGVVQAPGGKDEDPGGGFAHGGWSAPFFDTETMGTIIDEFMGGNDALLYGRRTWETMAGAWPGRAGDPFADQMNSIRKYVVSRTLSADEAAARWNNTTLLAGADEDAIAAIRELRASGGDGGLQVWGSASLVRQLVENDLVDEYLLMIEPILLGGGKSIYPADGRARTLELVSLAQAKTGVLVCTYRPAGQASPA
jgi:dihydrofolate reductase